MQKFTVTKLIQQNTLLRPKDKIHGIRKNSIRAGDPQTNKHAFYCVPAPQIAELLDDLLKYFNAGTDESSINKALIGMLQFIYIHPFKDGNGRIIRTLFPHTFFSHVATGLWFTFFCYLYALSEKH